ncbi:MAG: hypothetical protein HOH58_04435 [Opitutaceae bacterium]|jgi:hypothetical protein|nr:hypothetical protein [Opitutaceae bacterium]
MTTPKPFALISILLMTCAGCATRGPMHLYSATSGQDPVRDQALESGADDELVGFLDPEDRVIGLGYEFNTDYIWLRLAPGNRLITIKRGFRELWYDYDLPGSFLVPEGESGDVAVRSFNRMVYVALAEPGMVGKIERYGDVHEVIQPGGSDRTIGGLAWDQVNDLLLVLYSDGVPAVVAYDNDIEEVGRVTFEVATRPTTLAYDSNRQRYYVPLAEAGWLGEFDTQGRLIARRAFPDSAAAIDAGQRSAVRMF